MKMMLLTLAAALLAAPLTLAHQPAGTPKNYCEPLAEWSTHEYGPPASGVLVAGFIDGNLAGDCDPGLSVTPIVSPSVRDPLESEVGADVNPPLADYDGHSEFAFGGAFLLAESGTGAYDPAGSGSLYCFGEAAHHSQFPLITVTDVALGSALSVMVGVDNGPGATFPLGAVTVQPQNPTSPDASGDASCGDGLVDLWDTCFGSCSPWFPPGMDGAYYVFIQGGTQGHVDAW